MSNILLDSISTKESRKYESVLDFPRFVINEILTEWKSYQVLKKHDKRRESIIRFIDIAFKIDEMNKRYHFDYESEDDIQIKETKFIDKTIYLVSGVDRDKSYKKEILLKTNPHHILYKYLDDGFDNIVIMFVDPIIEFYKDPMTLVNRDLQTYDKEWLELQSDKNLFSWFYKTYNDLREFIISFCTETTYPMYRVSMDCRRILCIYELLVQSVFTWYYSSEEDENNTIVKSKNNRFDSDIIVMMTIVSFHAYPYADLGNPFLKKEELQKSFRNIFELTKVIASEQFNTSDVLTRTILLKEKEYEINHE